ncbi:LytR/AlgR family response regulator transcription factor [Croceitalea rosinachiae]|uniref:LytTR family DNA-binding domain-containing protein n=1 Tax=Croceitalea rosinachiae TaxID=3075596 RepID=A0ABU3A6Z3_9FLAO|nr:LytTR family DNA-binding domain-containing protein [Croceitalea sp. F388]MDT0605947.1 LytTR family DNA-binding domain-containing protein [Croceitalea sp. F388]
MRVVIIEDEKAAAENLKFLLSEVDAAIQIDDIIETVSGAIDYFSKENTAELAFFDIHLADGISFEIFKQVQINVPIVFTTAYDEYALKAFKVNSIDYLLKPIDKDELREALVKYNRTQQSVPANQQFQEMLQILQIEKKKYKSTYLVHQRDTLVPLGVDEIAYFTIETGIVKAISFDNNEFIIDEKLEHIESELNPDQFFRVNRQFIVHRKAIENLQLYFNGKLILNLNPKPSEQVIVSKIKAPRLKQWIS